MAIPGFALRWVLQDGRWVSNPDAPATAQATAPATAPAAPELEPVRFITTVIGDIAVRPESQTSRQAGRTPGTADWVNPYAFLPGRHTLLELQRSDREVLRREREQRIATAAHNARDSAAIGDRFERELWNTLWNGIGPSLAAAGYRVPAFNTEPDNTESTYFGEEPAREPWTADELSTYYYPPGRDSNRTERLRFAKMSEAATQTEGRFQGGLLQGGSRLRSSLPEPEDESLLDEITKAIDRGYSGLLPGEDGGQNSELQLPKASNLQKLMPARPRDINQHTKQNMSSVPDAPMSRSLAVGPETESEDAEMRDADDLQ